VFPLSFAFSVESIRQKLKANPLLLQVSFNEKKNGVALKRIIQTFIIIMTEILDPEFSTSAI